jgi:flagellar L-ring protein precursor FlgH
MRNAAAAMTVLALTAGGAGAQSLFERPSAPAGGDGAPAAPAAPAIAEVSLTAVAAPEPREFAEHDLVTIIISERSKGHRKHEFDADKTSEIGGNVEATIDLVKLLEARLQQGRGPDDESLPVWAVELGKDFEATAEYKRDDLFTARVTAQVLEIKPNGNLLLEARTVITTDYETQTIVLTGVCRGEDVTDANTVQSNQMFDLRVEMQNEGEVRKGAEKGVITKVLDFLFAY